MRSIETSYRNAISVYLEEASSSNRLIKEISQDFHPDDIKNYFKNNDNYYCGLANSDMFMGTLKSTHKAVDMKYTNLTHYEIENIVDLYRSFNDCKNLDKILDEVEPAIFMYSLLAEYYSFNHLKKFIPDASQFFMDAVLSEPPISQGQRRRILFALDILLEGIVYVADEPLANLDFESSIPMLDEMMKYLEEYDSSILLLDQQLNQKVVDYLKRNSYLGNIYKFCDSEVYDLKIVREG